MLKKKREAAVTTAINLDLTGVIKTEQKSKIAAIQKVEAPKTFVSRIG